MYSRQRNRVKSSLQISSRSWICAHFNHATKTFNPTSLSILSIWFNRVKDQKRDHYMINSKQFIHPFVTVDQLLALSNFITRKMRTAYFYEFKKYLFNGAWAVLETHDSLIHSYTVVLIFHGEIVIWKNCPPHF